MFHAARAESTMCTGTCTEHPLQRARLIELINLINVQTQQRAYLSMDDIETTHVNMLGPDGLDKDSPAINRAWLKEKDP